MDEMPVGPRQQVYFVILLAFGAAAIWFGFAHHWFWLLSVLAFVPGMMLGAVVCGAFRFP